MQTEITQRAFDDEECLNIQNFDEESEGAMNGGEVPKKRKREGEVDVASD